MRNFSHKCSLILFLAGFLLKNQLINFYFIFFVYNVMLEF